MSKKAKESHAKVNRVKKDPKRKEEIYTNDYRLMRIVLIVNAALAFLIIVFDGLLNNDIVDSNIGYQVRDKLCLMIIFDTVMLFFLVTPRKSMQSQLDAKIESTRTINIDLEIKPSYVVIHSGQEAKKLTDEETKEFFTIIVTEINKKPPEALLKLLNKIWWPEKTEADTKG